MIRALLAAALLMPCCQAIAATIEVEDPWIRAAPPGARMLAGYVVLHNRGAEAVALVGASSTRFGLAEIHETVDVDGVARMREVPRIEIAPASSARLEPGGRHIMLMRPESVPAEGESVDIVLRLEDGSTLTVPFLVRRAGAPPATKDPHAGH